MFISNSSHSGQKLRQASELKGAEENKVLSKKVEHLAIEETLVNKANIRF